jgi:hypothetical protein
MTFLSLYIDQEAKTKNELEMMLDSRILKNASIIGMTTTGAARMRKVLSDVACPIIILEEAAEVSNGVVYNKSAVRFNLV